MTCLTISTYICISLIGNALGKLDESAIIVTFDEKSTPISFIPFPAVTICPEIKAMRDKLNYTKTLNMIQEAMRRDKKFPYGLSGDV